MCVSRGKWLGPKPFHPDVSQTSPEAGKVFLSCTVAGIHVAVISKERGLLMLLLVWQSVLFHFPLFRVLRFVYPGRFSYIFRTELCILNSRAQMSNGVLFIFSL